MFLLMSTPQISKLFPHTRIQIWSLTVSLDNLDLTKEKNLRAESFCKKRLEGDGRLANFDLDREDECGICLEPCTKMVLPNCCHAMCIKCYRNW